MQIAELFKACIFKWGWRAQCDMAEEECAELIIALKNYKRNRGTQDEIREEVADMEIMCAQLRIMFDKGETSPIEGKNRSVDEWKDFKLERLYGRVYKGDKASMGVLAE